MRTSFVGWRAAVCIAVIAGALGVPTPGAAQSSTAVTGAVVDSASREPLPGVQVVVVGTSLGVLTDAEGRYRITSVPAGTVTLRLLRIGYGSAEREITVAVGQTATADFALRATPRTLSEIVVTGYGTSIREQVSSSIASVSGETLQNAPVAGLDAALQGKAAGVQVIQNAGNPGVGITVRVRGHASLSASNQPLYIIDGVPMLREDFSQIAVGGQDITAVTSLSPDEIEHLDVLKDAAAAAIYGSRASNGVIMITTKRGRAGRPRFNFSAYYGQQEIERKMELTNSSEFIDFINAARVNDGFSPRFTPGVDDAVDTDWQDVVTRTAPVSDLFLSMDGGTERIRYFLSGSLFDQEGIVLGSSYDRQTGSAKIDFHPSDRFSVRSSVLLTRENHGRITNDNTIEGVMANAIANQPMFPVRQPDGRYTDPTDRVGNAGVSVPMGYINPVAVADFNFRESRTHRVLGSVEGSYLFTDRLRLNARGALDVLNLRDLRWDSPRVIGSYAEGVSGVSIQGNNNVHKYVLESYLQYDHAASLGEFSVVGGASTEYNEQEWGRLRGETYAHTDFQYPGNAASVTEYAGDRTGNNLASFFARATATLHDRYLLTASIRTDGSSRFGENSRWGTFPAVSAGWIIGRERFLERVGPLADLKLRASYGETGNQDIGDDFAPIERYGEAKYAGVAGIAPQNIGNPNLKWETTREFDLGFDLALFDDRVTLIGDYYVKKTDDLLVTRPITLTSGFASIWDNVGSIENRGFELGLQTVNLDRGGFTWRTDFNISWNRNEVTHLYGGQPFNSGFDDINRYEVGQPMGAFYTVRFAGVDPQTGDALYLDRDGVAHAFGDREPTADDRVIVGSPHPDYWGGLSNSFAMRGIELRTFVQFVQGNEIYDGKRAYSDDGGVSRYDNKNRSVTRYWKTPGDVTDVPRPSVLCSSGACIVSDRWIEDASYVRLQEVTLSYTLPRALTRQTNVENVRVFVSGRNLKTWTDYSGFNPEANSAGSNSNTTLANEFYSYPLARTFSFGISGSW